MEDKLKPFLDETAKLVGIDFGPLESRMLIQLLSVRKDGKLIYTPIDPVDFYKGIDRPAEPIHVTTGRGANFVIIDEYANFMDVEPEAPSIEPPPMKQNGRSAAYLAHDPTKRHRRRRT